MDSIGELIWKLVKNAKQIEITEDFLRRLEKANVGEILEVKGFWNKISPTLLRYSAFPNIAGSDRMLAEIRTEHEPGKGQYFLISLTKEQKAQLGMLDDYAYLFIKGKKRRCPYFFNEKSETIHPNLFLLEVEDIKRENIRNYYEDDALIRNFDVNRATDLLYKFIPDNNIVEGIVINILNEGVEGTGRDGRDVPLVFNNDIDKKMRKHYIKNFKSSLLQIVDEPEESQHTFKVGLLSDKRIHKNTNWIITEASNSFEPNNDILRRADAPILIRHPSLRFQGIALNNFENDDISFLKLFRKLAFVFKSATPNLKIDKFDKGYVEGFMDAANDLPTNKKYYYLGLSLHDRIISTNLTIGYGRRLNLANTLSKDKKSNVQFDTEFTFAEDLVRDAIDNKTLLGNEQEVYRDGVKLDKKGFGSLKREIVKIRNIITDEGGYGIEYSKFSKLVGSEISFPVVDNLDKHGLLVRRLNGKISLHPALFR